MDMPCKNANQHELKAKSQLTQWQRLAANDHPTIHFRLVGNDKVPDPRYPFLGVHFTRMVGEGMGSEGDVECGPNAVLALARHGYRWRDLDPGDILSTLGFSGFRKLAREHWQMGVGEIKRSLRKEAFVRSLQRLIPDIRSEDLVAGRAGVRAQAVRADGSLVDDFLFRKTPRMTHVVNAPSPAATASLAIADRILEVHRKLENTASMD